MAKEKVKDKTPKSRIKNDLDTLCVNTIRFLSIEAGVTLGWRPYIGKGIATIGVDRFGASAPGKVIMKEYGLTLEAVIQKAAKLVEQKRKM